MTQRTNRNEASRPARRAAVHNLGCKVNYYEAERMKDALAAAGYVAVPFTEYADVYVVNTCTVTAVADKKSRQLLHRARRLNPQAVIVAAGCYAAQDVTAEELGCDLLLKNDEKDRLVERLEECFAQRGGAATGQETADEADAVRGGTDVPLGARVPSGAQVPAWAGQAAHTRAFVKIQDGCNRFCSYCIIPYVRGRVRSRPAEEILAEIDTLVAGGCREVVLTGIHLSSYKDTGDREAAPSTDAGESDDAPARTDDAAIASRREDDADLIALCERIDRETDLARLRLGSLEPRIVTEDFARRLSRLACICPHFHLSLQSGCDAVIARMNRHYTTTDFSESVRLLRAYFTDPAITTDVITGFPGESDEEFAEGRAFLEKMRFYEMHVFPYSRRKGTPAARMAGQVPNRVKHARSEELIALAEAMSREYRRQWQGREVEVLFEERQKLDGRMVWAGFSREYIRVYLEAEQDLRNQIVTLRYDGGASLKES